MQDYLADREILVTDDDSQVRLFLMKILRHQNPAIELREAADGLIAIEQLKRRVPDLLILDVDMPRAGGRDVLRWIQTEPSLEYMPVLVLTGAGEDVETEVIGLGAWDFTEKPVSRAILLARVQCLLRTRHRIQRLQDQVRQLQGGATAAAAAQDPGERR